MNARMKWMARDKMVKRGARVLAAHLTNRIDDPAMLAVWFRRNIHRYAAFAIGNVKPTDMVKVQKVFWWDCEKEVYAKCGWVWDSQLKEFV